MTAPEREPAIPGNPAVATPRPWVFDTWAPTNVYSDDATGSIIAKCGPFGFAHRPPAEASANAELIVRAVNCHDEWAAALRLIVELGDRTLIMGPDADPHERQAYSLGAHRAFAQAADIARDALAKASPPTGRVSGAQSPNTDPSTTNASGQP